MNASPSLVWFRRDLRLADNPALTAARRRGAPVVALYVLDEDSPGIRPPGGAARWWLHHSLAALAKALSRRGLPLVLRRGPAAAAVRAVVADCGAAAVYWNRVYEPAAVERDRALMTALRDDGVAVESSCASMLHEPWTVATGAGTPYTVFTPYWRAARATVPAEPAPPAPSSPRVAAAPAGDRLDDWALQPRPDWAGEIAATWEPGETGAAARLEDFLDRAAAVYRDGRERPGIAGTSALSPHLHFGEIGPRQVWHRVRHEVDAGALSDGAAEAFLRELGWREFCMQLLFHHPDLPAAPLRAAFAAFPWRRDDAGLAAWRRGLTGYPIVDAGMRQLWRTGWMHNRVRMIAASFLVKDLLVDWRAGEAWFWDTLVDADLASNVANWQWVAGCGADAAPYFRIFNPVTQSRKFDPRGDYLRVYVPELARLDDRHIHAPWQAPAAALVDAGVTLGVDYPPPIVDHGAARERALAAFATIRK